MPLAETLGSDNEAAKSESQIETIRLGKSKKTGPPAAVTEGKPAAHTASVT